MLCACIKLKERRRTRAGKNYIRIRERRGILERTTRESEERQKKRFFHCEYSSSRLHSKGETEYR